MPKGGAILANTAEFQKQPLQFVMKYWKQYGDVVHFRVALLDWYLVAHPDLVWEITVNRASEFQKPLINKRIFKLFLGNGVLSSDGDFWKRQHKMMLPGFHKQRIDAYGEIMVRYTEELLQDWKQGEQRDFCADMNSLTLRVVAKTLFDADVRGAAKRFGEAMRVIDRVLVSHINLPLPLPKWWPSKANRQKILAIREIEGIIHDIINERRASGEDRGDLLSMLVFAKDDAGGGMTDQQLRDESMTLFFAGHETTAHALTWMWFLLARHPAVQTRLKEELRGVLGDRSLTVADLPNLPYLDMVVKESMRILPSVWSFMRQPIEDTQIGDFLVPKNAQVFICTYILHHDPRYWDEPEEFRPERFSREEEKKIHRGAYMPFGAGPRICLGKSFAMMEARLILGTLIQNAEANVPDGYEIDPVPQLSLHPRDGLPTEVRFQK